MKTTKEMAAKVLTVIDAGLCSGVGEPVPGETWGNTKIMNPIDPKLLEGFDVDYYDYECGKPCTPDGCRGHSTDIPMSFTLGGVTFHVEGAESGDFPDEKENVNRVKSVVDAIAAMVIAHKSKKL